MLSTNLKKKLAKKIFRRGTNANSQTMKIYWSPNGHEIYSN